MSKPMKGLTCTVMPSMTPAAQASAPPIIQVARMTRSTSTPATRANTGFSDTARMARPIGLFAMKRSMTMTITAVNSRRKI